MFSILCLFGHAVISYSDNYTYISQYSCKNIIYVIYLYQYMLIYTYVYIYTYTYIYMFFSHLGKPVSCESDILGFKAVWHAGDWFRERHVLK